MDSHTLGLSGPSMEVRELNAPKSCSSPRRLELWLKTLVEAGVNLGLGICKTLRWIWGRHQVGMFRVDAKQVQGR